MSEKIIAKITNLLISKSSKKYEKDSDNYEVLKYGVAVVYYAATKTIILIVVSILLGIWRYTLAYSLVFGGLRQFAKGIHLKSNIGCTIMGFANYTIGIYVAMNFSIAFLPTISLFAVCFVLNAIYAPSPTEKSPIAQNKRVNLKLKTLVVMTILFILIFVIGENVYRNIVLIATISETLHILPITYRIFNEKRGVSYD